MLIGYYGDLYSNFAAFRTRVLTPSPYIGYPYAFGTPANITIIYRRINDQNWTRTWNKPIIYDITNALFNHNSKLKEEAYLYTNKAQVVTTCSEQLKIYLSDYVKDTPIVVIPDPYETPERPFSMHAESVLWYGHEIHIPAAKKYEIKQLKLMSKPVEPGIIPWTLWGEDEAITSCGMVFVCGFNTMGSPNRILKALRAGKFVLIPANRAVPQSWLPLLKYCWVGDPERGRQWALKNPGEAKSMVEAGQDYIRYRFSPATIGCQWNQVIASIKL